MKNEFVFNLDDFRLSDMTMPSHNTVALNILNTCAKKCPNTALALASYNQQKWAYSVRLRLRQHSVIDQIDSAVITFRLLSELYDIPAKLIMPEHDRCIEDTKAILSLVETAIDELRSYPKIGEKMYQIMRYLHMGKPLEKEISRYEISKYYRLAVSIIAAKYEDKLADKLLSANQKYNGMDEEYRIVYHNTEILLEYYPTAKWHLNGIQDYGNMSEQRANLTARQIAVTKLVEDAVESIKSYPVKGNLYNQILNCILAQQPVWVICRTLALGRSTFYKERKKAIFLLSYILWGYSTRDIIYSMQ